MSNGSASIAPLSASAGGAPVLLDVTTVPGKLIHTNPADSGVIARVVDVLVGNPNAQQISLGAATVGPGSPAPPDFESMVRIDVPPTAEGTVVRIFYTPFVLQAGYSYYLSAKLNPGDRPPYLYGYVENFFAQGALGYGGLIRRTPVALGNIAATNWITVNYEAGLVTNPVNIAQDPANNRFTINAPGIWFISSYGTIQFDRNQIDDRVLRTRLFNETAGQPVTQAPFPLYMEQGTTGAIWSYTTLFEVSESLVPGVIRQELGGEPTFAVNNISMDKCGITLVRISPTI